MTTYLAKYIVEAGRYEILKPTESITVAGVVIGLNTNIVTVSGVNSLQSVVSAVSGTLNAKIDTVSGASLTRDNVLQANINAVSGASSLRDDQQDIAFAAYSAARALQRTNDLAAQDARDDLQDVTLNAVSGYLQGQIDDILSDTALVERFEAAVSGAPVTFTLTTINFDPSPAVRDIVVYKNGIRQYAALNGTITGTVSGGDYEKVGANQVRFLRALAEGDRIIVRDERTGGSGGGGGGDFDIGNLLEAPAPLTPGSQPLGTVTKPFSYVHLLDPISLLTYRIQVVSGILQAVVVP